MLRDDPNREFLLVVAGALGDLCDEVVFVGGSVRWAGRDGRF